MILNILFTLNNINPLIRQLVFVHSFNCKKKKRIVIIWLIGWFGKGTFLLGTRFWLDFPGVINTDVLLYRALIRPHLMTTPLSMFTLVWTFSCVMIKLDSCQQILQAVFRNQKFAIKNPSSWLSKTRAYEITIQAPSPSQKEGRKFTACLEYVVVLGFPSQGTPTPLWQRII